MTTLLTRAPAPPDDEQQDEQGDDAALAASVAAAFLLTDQQVETLAAGITTARVTAYRATYLAAADVTGASLDAPGGGNANWQPDDDARSDQQRQAQDAAHSIASTYQQDVTAAALAFLAAWRSDHSDAAQQGQNPMAGAPAALRSHLHTWANARAEWKSAQVAGYETSDAGHDGTQAAASDFTDGDWLDDMGDVLDPTNYLVAIVPSESSSDFCFDYAGNTYAFDDAPSLDFPAHVNCIHYMTFIPIGDEDSFD